MKPAGNALFSAGGEAAFDSLGNLTPAAQSGGVELGGGAAIAGEMLSTLMAAYTAVMIAIMLIQMIWSCEMPEYELAAKKQLKVCNHLPTDQNAASMLNLDQLTGTGSRLESRKIRRCNQQPAGYLDPHPGPHDRPGRTHRQTPGGTGRLGHGAVVISPETLKR